MGRSLLSRVWALVSLVRFVGGVQIEKKDLAWERYYDLSAQELGTLINMAKMGKQLHKSVPRHPMPVSHAGYATDLSSTSQHCCCKVQLPAYVRVCVCVCVCFCVCVCVCVCLRCG